MTILITDCETDGFLDVLTKVHSLCFKDFSTGELISSYGDVSADVKRLEDADKLVFHNGLNFDVPALKKVYPWFRVRVNQIIDTLILSRLMAPHIHEIDGKIKGFPKALIGSHSLEAWGIRLGKHKGDYAKEMEARGLDPWAHWSPQMQAYCENDVEVTAELFRQMVAQGIPERASELEHWFAYICYLMEQRGFAFDHVRAQKLYDEIEAKLTPLDEKLRQEVEPWYRPGKEFTPKQDNTSSGYVEGATFTRIKLTQFNPGSRQQIGEVLTKFYGWEPLELTPTGLPKVDEEGLLSVEHPIGKEIAERFILSKRLGQIKDGEKGWLKLHKYGFMHGRVNTLGAVTGRCSHADPNMAQVPAVVKNKKGEVLKGFAGFYGFECRALFHARPGFVLVGADASGLELRCLAHFMAEYDGGAYAKELLEGDIHTANQLAAGLPTRDMAKTFIYGFLYGAGDAKIGKIVGGDERDGKRLKESFLAKTPALRQLRNAVLRQAKEQGYIKGIDGRNLYVRHEHAVLNTLLQSAGALLVKQATINLFKELTRKSFTWGVDWAIVAHVHDEFQLEVREGLEKEVAEVAVWSFQQAGRDFDWRCPLDGEAKIGRNWAETH